MRNKTTPDLKSLEDELVQIKARQDEINSEVAKLEEERTQLKTREAEVILPLIQERDRLDALVKGQKNPLTEEERICARHVDELELTVRPANCLKSEGIKTIGDLLKHTEHDLMKIPGLGRAGLSEIRMTLGNRGLNIGQRAGAKT
jgi:DNA-directed RNA polymerase subunit alpha